MPLREWVKLPTGWIEAGGLKTLQWTEQGSDGIAALMVLIAVAHSCEQDSGVARLTYERLSDITGLSRTMVSAGLTILDKHKILKREPRGRSTYGLVEFGPSGWGKLPARRPYTADRISAFSEFHLRSYTELNALKFYLMVVARRDNKTNLAHMTYQQIEAYAQINGAHIKAAISLLAANGLMHVEHVQSANSQFGIANAYRLAHLDPYIHMGTRGRSDASNFFNT